METGQDKINEKDRHREQNDNQMKINNKLLSKKKAVH